VKLVLDTNVLVSGMINPAGPPGRIVDRVRIGALTLVVDDRILAEYTRVLRRRRFAGYFSNSQVRDVLAFLYAEAERMVAGIAVGELPDPEDTPFLEIALTAEVPLVSGNLADFPGELRRGAMVLSPAEYVQEYLVEE
jgi:putative PIN family toxin of toxin-antitoxin system